MCDLAVLRAPFDTRRFASAIVGHERRYCALAADDPWARKRSIGLNEIPDQYRRDGVVFRPLRDAPPVIVQMIWRRQDPHPSTHAAIALLTELYGRC